MEGAAIADGQRIPAFVSALHHPSPYFYFHHVVDAEEATLTVEVIGPNLQLRFTHARARECYSVAKRRVALGNKVVGYLALVTGSGERVVLAAAESGHGHGTHGDVLDVADGVLSNRLWTRRVVAVGKALGLAMGSPFDRAGRSDGSRRGLFQGSHVEVKLAVHGICVLLRRFGITRDLQRLTREHLRRLRGVRWADGSRPALEVYFSRRNCQRCGVLVARLAAATGIAIELCWRDRLDRKEYVQGRTNKARAAGLRVRPGTDEPAPETDPQDLDFDDAASTCSDATLPGSNDNVDHDDDEVVPLETIDLTQRDVSLRAASHMTIADPVDDFLDGLAYRIGQLHDDPAGAALAVVQFAQKMAAMARRRDEITIVCSRRRPAPQPQQRRNAARCISKPLPATPVTKWPEMVGPSPARTGAATPETPTRPVAMTGPSRVASPIDNSAVCIGEVSPSRTLFRAATSRPRLVVAIPGRPRTTGLTSEYFESP